MNKRLSACPVCNSSLEIEKYHCPNCNTDIQGEFGTGQLDILSPKQQEFVKIFVCNEGNIKKVEKIMGISYPTVKNRILEIKSLLCPNDKIKSTDDGTETILVDLDKGKISVKDAIKKFSERSEDV